MKYRFGVFILNINNFIKKIIFYFAVGVGCFVFSYNIFATNSSNENGGQNLNENIEEKDWGKRMGTRKIVTDDMTVLRQKSKKVEIFDEKLNNFVLDMVQTLKEIENGVGLAAVQVGVLKQVIVVDLKNDKDFFVLINPKIVEASKEEEEGIEGCLSFPNKSGKVKRPKHIKVVAQDVKGKEIEIVADGFLARVICHEVDHLEGKVFLDRVEK